MIMQPDENGCLARVRGVWVGVVRCSVVWCGVVYGARIDVFF